MHRPPSAHRAAGAASGRRYWPG